MTIINPNGIDKAKVCGWASSLLDLERQIKDLQDAKATIYKRVRADYNSAVAHGLKGAVALLRMDPHVREQKIAAGVYVKEFVKMIDEIDAGPATVPTPANQNTPGPSRDGATPSCAHEAAATVADLTTRSETTGNGIMAISDATPTHEKPINESWRDDLVRDRVKPIQTAHVVLLDAGEMPEFMCRRKAAPLDHPIVEKLDEAFDPDTGELIEPVKYIEDASAPGSTHVPSSVLIGRPGDLGNQQDELEIVIEPRAEAA